MSMGKGDCGADAMGTGNGRAGFLEYLLDGFVWCETFVLLGAHCFWVLAKSAPLTEDTASSVYLAAIPFLMLAWLGVVSLHANVRAAIGALEAVFHGIAGVLMTALLFFAVLRDPFAPVMPLATPLYVWSAALCFLLAANFAAWVRRGRGAKPAPGAAWRLIAAVIWIAGMLWIVSGAAWVVYFWTFSAVIHALAAWRGARSTEPPEASLPRLGVTGRGLAAAECLCVAAMLFAAQILCMFCHADMGTLESKYILFLEPFRSPAFYLGMAVFWFAARFRATPLAHIVAAALVLFGAKGTLGPFAYVLGHCYAALFSVTRRQSGLEYALAVFIAAFCGMLGLVAFSFSGLIVHFGFDGGALPVLVRGGHAAVAVCLLGYLAAVALDVLVRKKAAALEPEPAVPVNARFTAFIFVGVLAVAVLPGWLLLRVTTGPFHKPPRLDGARLDAPMGLCHAGYSQSDEEYRVLDALGAQVLRVDFTWSSIQPAPDTWDFNEKDGFVEAANKHGKRVLAVLNYDNNAVERDPIGRERGMYVAPSDVPLFAEYATRLAQRYGGRVYAWEIWNEPDMDRFWTGTPEELYALAAETATAIRAAVPDARIVGPAMTGPLGALMTPMIDGLHTSGAAAKVDHPACHLYTTDPRHYCAEFAKIAAAAQRYGHPGTPWLTEVGAPDGGYYPWCTEEDRLAEHTIKAYTAATSLGMDLVVWYCKNDADLGSQAKQPSDSERFFGLLGPGEVWKPSAYAYKLFSESCSDSVLRPGLVHLSGGLAARQMRAALYRRDNGESTLILWFEPMLRPWGQARVSLDLGAADGIPVSHDIGSDYVQALLNDHLLLGEKPAVITWKSSNAETPVRIATVSSPVDALWLLLAAGMSLSAIAAAIRGHAIRNGHRPIG